MERVQITVFGKLALVDKDMVKKMLKKSELVAGACRLQAVMNAVPREAEPILQKQLQDMCSKIRRLNRTIRRTVQYI